MASSERRDWTDGELDLIVSDYFLMLKDDAAGIPFNKREHNRALQNKISRSQGSIEFKHQNISAVLQELGLPRIKGYLPAANYQRAIIAAIDRFLTRTPTALHPEEAVDGFAERPALFVQTPPTLSPARTRPKEIERLVQKFDPAVRDFRNRKLGHEGEEMVFHHERQRLLKHDRSDLARKMRWVSQEDGDGAGYDILSFDDKGRERLLEVKTTVGSEVTPFYITRNELSLSSERPDAFRLCRVYEFSTQPRMFELLPPLDKLVHLAPFSYVASFS